MLDALKTAGVEKALLQISINNTDHLGRFPNAEFPDNDGWSKAVRRARLRAGHLRHLRLFPQ